MRKTNLILQGTHDETNPIPSAQIAKFELRRNYNFFTSFLLIHDSHRSPATPPTSLTPQLPLTIENLERILVMVLRKFLILKL